MTLPRRTLIASLPSTVLGLAALPAQRAHAHHGWSSFDQSRPIYLEGKASSVAWRNPHAEFKLTLASPLVLPSDLKSRTLPTQTAGVDGAGLLAKAQLPKRSDKLWQIELAPLTRLEAWQVAPIQNGDSVAMLGFTFEGERGDAVLRVEYLFAQGKVFGLRSSPT